MMRLERKGKVLFNRYHTYLGAMAEISIKSRGGIAAVLVHQFADGMVVVGDQEWDGGKRYDENSHSSITLWKISDFCWKQILT